MKSGRKSNKTIKSFFIVRESPRKDQTSHGFRNLIVLKGLAAPVAPKAPNYETMKLLNY